MFKTKQDLFQVLQFDDSFIVEQSDPYEYFPIILYSWETWYELICKANRLYISWLYKQGYEHWLYRAEEIKIHPNSIHNLMRFNLGTQKLVESVNTVSIDYNIRFMFNKSQVFEDLDYAHEYFKNLKKFNLENARLLSLSEISRILNKYRINYLSSSNP